jgi:hypothetical protein
MDMYRRREETGQDTTEIPPEEFFSIYDISEERIEIAGTLPVQTEVRLKVTLRETKQESTKDIHKRPKVIAVIDPVRKMDAADPNWCRQELMLKTTWGKKDSWPECRVVFRSIAVCCKWDCVQSKALLCVCDAQ